MSDLVGNAESKFSEGEAYVDVGCNALSCQSMAVYRLNTSVISPLQSL